MGDQEFGRGGFHRRSPMKTQSTQYEEEKKVEVRVETYSTKNNMDD